MSTCYRRIECHSDVVDYIHYNNQRYKLHAEGKQEDQPKR